MHCIMQLIWHCTHALKLPPAMVKPPQLICRQIKSHGGDIAYTVPADRYGKSLGWVSLLVLMAWRPLELLPVPPLLTKLAVVGGVLPRWRALYLRHLIGAGAARAAALHVGEFHGLHVFLQQSCKVKRNTCVCVVAQHVAVLRCTDKCCIASALLRGVFDMCNRSRTQVC